MAKLFGNNNKEQYKEKQSPFSSVLSLVFIIILVIAFKSSILDANNIPTGSMIPTLKIGDFLFVNKMRYSIRMPGTEKEILRIDDPKRGDIVTFDPPNHAISEEKSQLAMLSKRFVKRVVGMPGDTVRINRKSMETTRGRVDYSFFEFKEKGADVFQNYNPSETQTGKELSDLDNPDASRRALFLEEKRNFKHFVLEGDDDGRLLGMGGEFRFGCDFKIGCEIPEGQYMVMGDNRDDSSDSRVWGFVRREDILGKALIIYFSINWKDNTCIYKDENELALQGPEIAGKWQGDDLKKVCHPAERNSQGFRGQEETRFGWFDRTLRYRLWRLNVRWSRIGKILE